MQQEPVTKIIQQQEPIFGTMIPIPSLSSVRQCHAIMKKFQEASEFFK
jgi:hypothetical protein